MKLTKQRIPFRKQYHTFVIVVYGSSIEDPKFKVFDALGRYNRLGDLKYLFEKDYKIFTVIHNSYRNPLYTVKPYDRHRHQVGKVVYLAIMNIYFTKLRDFVEKNK